MDVETGTDWMVWLRQQRDKVTRILLTFLLMAGLVGLAFSFAYFLRARGTGRPSNFPYYLAAYLLALALAYIPKFDKIWRAWSFLAAVYAFALFSFMAGWLSGGGRPFLLSLVVISAVMIGPKAGLAMAVISLLTYAAFGLSFNQGWLALQRSDTLDTTVIVVEGVGFAMTLGLTALSVWFFAKALKAANNASLEAKKSRKSFHNIVERSSEGIIVANVDGTVCFANAAVEKILGESPSALTGRPLPFPLRSAGSSELCLSEGRQEALYLELRATKTEWEGAPATLFSFQDINDRKRVEKEREFLIKDLESKNSELERFTYSVSHDLKSPLITIRGFLGYLEKDALSGDIERLRGDIRRIENATAKMQQLLDELLELSRIGRIVNETEEIAFGKIVEDALALVEGRLAERRVRVETQADLPVVVGDRARFVEVVQNLVDNAAKFTGDREDPLIRIGMEERGGKRVFFVADNGIGIESAYRERIFRLFEKLDPKGPGTGIGLALVKRIVELNGGEIWVESEGPGRGSVFYFSLPLGASL